MRGYVSDDVPTKLETMRKNERISKLWFVSGSGLLCTCTLAELQDSKWIPNRHEVAKARDEGLLRWVDAGTEKKPKRLIMEYLSTIFAVCHLRFFHAVNGVDPRKAAGLTVYDALSPLVEVADPRKITFEAFHKAMQQQTLTPPVQVPVPVPVPVPAPIPILEPVVAPMPSISETQRYVSISLHTAQLMVAVLQDAIANGTAQE